MSAEHVLLITIDSLRDDRLFRDGAEAILAPNIEALAETGAVFDEAVANGPNTPSSFPSILTSTHPLMYGGYRYLDENRPFVSKQFRQAGFQTVGFHSNPHLGPEKNYDAGFDTFNHRENSDDGTLSLKNLVDRYVDVDSRLYSILRRIYHYVNATTGSSAYTKAPTITDDAVGWLEDEWTREDRFFMWLHYMDVHYPFMPPDRFVQEVGADPLSKNRMIRLNADMQEDPGSMDEADVTDLVALYNAEIRYLDYHLGTLLDELTTRNLLDDTLIMVTADHGEAFGEHGRFGHHPYLYDELLRVPLVMAGPSINDAVVDEQVSLVDLGPTMYDVAGIETPNAVQGVSLIPFAEGKATDERVALCTGAGGKTLASRTSKWKCFWKIEEDTVKLYDIEDDPQELIDVSSNHPSVVSDLRGEIEAYLETAESTDVELPEVDETDEVKQRLRDLGYTS